MRASTNIWNDVWIADCEGMDGLASKFVVVATRGQAQQVGFCGWDMGNGEQVCICIHPLEMSTLARTPVSVNHWHTTNGPTIMYGSNGSKGIRLFDVRGGEYLHGWEM